MVIITGNTNSMIIIIGQYEWNREDNIDSFSPRPFLFHEIREIDMLSEETGKP